MTPPNIVALASTLHEIRTPIQTILGTAELLKSTNLDPEQQEYVRQIAFSADVIHTLANDILDFEKLRTGNLTLEHIAFNPSDIIEQVLNLVSIEAYNKGIELLSFVHPQVPQKLIGDPLRIQQILLNMVKNAVKFTPKGYVRVEVQRHGEQTFLFKIIDSGVGVPEEKKPTIFQPFVQASTSTTRQYGGSGLGLNICSQLVSLMKGNSGVEDNPEGGSIFYFSIPLEEGALEDGQEQKIAIAAGAKVLVVDDSPQYLENISRTISAMTNLTVATASSGTTALQMLREAAKQQQDFSLVLMDMGMPSMDGWRLAAEINKDSTINGAKLYLMIPEGQLGGEAKMKLLSWFNGYLYKPVQRKKLLDLLVHAFTQPLELPTVEMAEAEEQAQITAQSKMPSFQKLVREKITPTAQKPQQSSQVQAAPVQNLPEQEFPSPIIAVDDHPVNLKILTTFLSSLGVEAYGATSGEKAIALAQQYPDTKIIFMDIEMPFMNGFETSSKLRENGYQGIIVACSANSTPDIIQEYIKAGINDYFAKPFKKQQLSDLLAKWQKLPQIGTNGLWQGQK